MIHRRFRCAPLLLVVMASACGPTAQLELPARFAVLEPPRYGTPTYTIHAATADGVVVGVQEIEHRVRGDLAFWSDAVERRLRDQRGYALLSTDDVSSATGVRGRTMHFGRELSGHQYRYDVTVFVTDARIYVVEAGGREEAFQAAEAEVQAAIRGIRM